MKKQPHCKISMKYEKRHNICIVYSKDLVTKLCILVNFRWIVIVARPGHCLSYFHAKAICVRACVLDRCHVTCKAAVRPMRSQYESESRCVGICIQ